MSLLWHIAKWAWSRLWITEQEATVDLRPRSTGTCAQCGRDTGSDAVSFCCYDHQRAWYDGRRGAA